MIKEPERRCWRHSGNFSVDFKYNFTRSSNVFINNFEHVIICWTVVWVTQVKFCYLKYLDLANFGKLAVNVRDCERDKEKCIGKYKKCSQLA